MCFGIEWGRLIGKIIISQFVEVRMRTGGLICPSPSGWWEIYSTSYSQGVAVGLYLLQPFRLVAGDGFASYTQGVAIGLNVSQPFRLMVGDGFAFYPRRCRWAISVPAFQAGGG
jgi:hypothetical protein